ncbi:hypothetical protein NPIL_275391, partial [Nephila pilipes]
MDVSTQRAELEDIEIETEDSE